MPLNTTSCDTTNLRLVATHGCDKPETDEDQRHGRRLDGPFFQPRDAEVRFSMSEYMRANGVPDFPDPRARPEGSSGGVGWPGGGPVMISSDVLAVMGRRLAGPAVAAAAKVCKEYMAPSGPPPSPSESQRVAALHFAPGMRADGLNFPDPTFAGGNRHLNPGPGLNPDSPAIGAPRRRAAGAETLIR